MQLDLPDRPPWVVLDTETSGLHPDDGARVACVSVTWPDTSADSFWEFYDTGEPIPLLTKAFPFDQGVRDKFDFQQFELGLFGAEEDPNLPKEAWDALLDWLQRQNLVYHGGKFDMHMMRVGTRHWRGVDLGPQFHWDTMIANRVLDPLHDVGLDTSCDRLGLGKKVGVDRVVAWLLAHKYPKRRYDLVPWDIIRPYVEGDTEMGAALYLHQCRRISTSPAARRQAWDSRIREKFDLLMALYRMEERGIGYEENLSREAAEVLEARAVEIEKRMPFRCTEKEGKKYFFQEQGLPADRYTEKREEPCLDEEQVRKWAVQGIPWAKEYSDVTRARRAVSMWYRGYPDKMGLDGRLRTNFKPTSVKSGRMSVERVQLQAIPKKDKYKDIVSGEMHAIYEGVPGVRELLRPADGCGLWSLDLSQAELRVAAKYAQCRNMLRMLAEGADMHAETCKGTMHIDPDHPLWKEKRDIAKRLNFGGIFMIGWETFQATLSKLANIHLDEQECRKIVSAWRRLYPEFRHAYNKAQDHAKKHGWVEVVRDSPYARKSWFGPRDWPNTAWNREVQGSLAEIFGIWMGETEKRWPGYLILTIHDSLVLECKLDEGDQIAREVAAFGVELFSNAFSIDMRVDTDRW